MHTADRTTLVLSSADIQQLVRKVGLDEFMDQLIDRLSAAMQQLDPTRTHIPKRSGFNYQQPHTGLVEWMPIHQLGQQVVIKVVGYHPANPQQYHLPTILSTISAYDVRTGHLLALIDGVFVTALRTGAASAIASRCLAHPDSKVLGLIGCGAQAVAQLHAIQRLFPLEEVYCYDTDTVAMYSLAERCGPLGANLRFRPTPLEEVVAQADILCTATSVEVGAGPVFADSDHQTHLHVNAVGADFPGKVELPLSFLRKSYVCPDFLDQAVVEGECQQLDLHEIGADIVQLVQQPADFTHLRTQTTVYDSTGWALQDYVVMLLFTDLAKASGVGQFIELEGVTRDVKNPYDFIWQERPQSA
ncbi:MAG: ornithine cyclodeaminase family protein [Bacteroidetes bacterium]|nr:MAG: ornithine cyclodeaminase family protein [Bacteroidota bacterium]